jgi:hypothetical protein
MLVPPTGVPLLRYGQLLGGIIQQKAGARMLLAP